MAKNQSPKDEKYPYPSRFGSHQTMLDKEKTEKLNKEGRVICLDEYGEYETDAKRLDDGMADINRYQWRGEKK